MIEHLDEIEEELDLTENQDMGSSLADILRGS